MHTPNEHSYETVACEALIARWQHMRDYLPCWQDMQQFTNARNEQTIDEIWMLEHTPVFTQGQNGKSEHILDAGHIPVIKTDRGGQVTYHGPGQLMVYTLIDVRRKKLNTRQFVSRLEQSIIDYLASHQIIAYARVDAPGVYIEQQKICSIGLRIRRGFAYHGIAFNVNMDIGPFLRINPCGFAQLKMTQLIDHIPERITPKQVSAELIPHLVKNLNYAPITCIDGR